MVLINLAKVKINFLFVINVDQNKKKKQYGGSNTTKPGIEFVVPPGSSETDINLIRTLNELSTQTNENQRYDSGAMNDLTLALYGNKTQKGSGNKKRKKRKSLKKKRKSFKKKRKSLRKKRLVKKH